MGFDLTEVFLFGEQSRISGKRRSSFWSTKRQKSFRTISEQQLPNATKNTATVRAEPKANQQDSLFVLNFGTGSRPFESAQASQFLAHPTCSWLGRQRERSCTGLESETGCFRWARFQSSGGKAMPQNLGEGVTNSTPTSALPFSISFR